MEPIVIAATITGIAAIIAAAINAFGNVSAAKHKAATEKPAQKEVAQEVITGHRIKKVDWWFWGILAFMVFWWVLTMATADFMGSRYTMALVILSPAAAAFMAMTKVVWMIVTNQRR